MAKRSSMKPVGRAGKAALARPARATTSRKPAEPEAVEAEDDGSGPGVDVGIVVMTTVMLLAAIVFVDAYLGKLGGGVFFS
jgi:hypothetical protein